MSNRNRTYLFNEKIIGPIVEEVIKSIITNIPGCSQNFNDTALIDTIINSYKIHVNDRIKEEIHNIRDDLIQKIEENKRDILHPCRVKDIKEKIMKIIMSYEYKFATLRVKHSVNPNSERNLKGGRKTRKTRKSRKSRKSRK